MAPATITNLDRHCGRQTQSGYARYVGLSAGIVTEFANGLCALQFPGPTLLGDPPQPRPELLTEDEAIRYLRLDTIDISEPSATLRRYRQRGLLRGTRISKRIFYRRAELNRFIERVTESNPR